MSLQLNDPILIISPEPWGKNFVSKHHYANTLTKLGHIVYFLNPPSNQNNVTSINNNLFLINYSSSFRGIAYFPRFISSWLIKKEIGKLEKLSGVVFKVIWNFDSSRFFNLAKLKNTLNICHIVDMSENFQRDILAQTSDICFCTSDFIAEELKPFNEKVFKIHHGYNTPSNNYTIPESFDSSKINVGYVGNLTRPCINWNILTSLIKNHPEITFNLIGGTNTSNLSNTPIEEEHLKMLESAPNVILLGIKESHLIPSYLEQFDILLSLYRIESDEDKKQHSNLHKTMEYIGSGKTTISTYSDEYKDKTELLEMTHDDSQFEVKFNTIIKNLEHYNSEKKQKERKQFAINNSYKNQIEQIKIHLNNIKK